MAEEKTKGEVSCTLSETGQEENCVLPSTKKATIFDELWANFPDKDLEHDAEEIDNYCAVNLGVSFIESNISLESYTGDKCWGCPTGKNNVHPIRAREFASWLKSHPFSGCPRSPLKLTGETFKENLKNKKGIIFFKDYWQRKHEIGTDRRTGDHIDLWNNSVLASEGALTSFFTTTLGLHLDGWYSNKELSKEVLFWEID